MNWNKLLFKNFITLQRGFDLPITEMKDGEIPVLGSTGIIGYHNRAKVNPPGVITGRSGTIGVIQYIDEPYWPHNTSLWVKDFKSNNPKFVYYKMQTLNLERFNGGASVPTLNRNNLDNIRVKIPCPLTQEKIAKILSAYDDFLKTNRRRIYLLEEEARLLFREWFVYFKFPGHEKLKIIDGVPEGWKREKIDKLVTFKRGVEPGSDNYLETRETGSFPFFRVSDLITRKPSIFVDEQYAKKAFIKKSDIVVSLDGSVGIVSIGLEGCYSTGIRKLIIKDKKVNRAYLYFLMKSHYLQGVINAYAKGTTIQHASEAIKHMNPILPPKNLMNLFDEIANPMLNEILVLFEENQKLAYARDLILPRLMNGAIEV